MTGPSRKRRPKKTKKAPARQTEFFPAPAPPPDPSYAFAWPGLCQPGQPYQDHLGRRWFLCAPMWVHESPVELPPDREAIFAGHTFLPIPSARYGLSLSHVGWRCAWITTAPPTERPVQNLARQQT